MAPSPGRQRLNARLGREEKGKGFSLPETEGSKSAHPLGGGIYNILKPWLVVWASTIYQSLTYFMSLLDVAEGFNPAVNPPHHFE